MCDDVILINVLVEGYLMFSWEEKQHPRAWFDSVQIHNKQAL